MEIISPQLSPFLYRSFQFTECEDPLKVSCGIGAYRDNDGKPLVMDAVSEAKKR